MGKREREAAPHPLSGFDPMEDPEGCLRRYHAVQLAVQQWADPAEQATAQTGLESAEALLLDFLSDQAEAALMHGPTYMGSPLACAAANASLDLFDSEPRLRQVAAIEAQLKRELAPVTSLPGVVDIRIKGAIGAIEVADLHNLDWLKAQFVAAGIWLRPFGNVIYTMPPFTITQDELSAIAGAISDILPRWADRTPTVG